jgi:hypothetical protein
MDIAPYSGPERRKRRVYVTHNTEYHMHEGVCVAVRDRRTGEWQRDHLAVGRKLEGALAHERSGAGVFHVTPEVGDSMLFQAGPRELITSPLERVDRPGRGDIAQYPPLRASAPSVA